MEAGRYDTSKHAQIRVTKPGSNPALVPAAPPSALALQEAAQVQRFNNRQLMKAALGNKPQTASKPTPTQTLPELVVASGDALQSGSSTAVRRQLAETTLALDAVLKNADDGGAGGAVHALRKRGVNIRPSRWTSVAFNLLMHSLFIWAVLAVLYEFLVAGEERAALQGQFVKYSSVNLKQALEQAGGVSSAQEAAFLEGLDPSGFAGAAPPGWAAGWDSAWPANLPSTWREDWPSTWPALPAVTLQDAVKASLPALRAARRMVPDKDPTAALFNSNLIGLAFLIAAFLLILFIMGTLALRFGADVPVARMTTSAVLHNLGFTLVIGAAEGLFFWFVGKHLIPEPPSSIIKNVLGAIKTSLKEKAASTAPAH